MHALPRPEPGWALFLDFDGTLVELRHHPAEVHAPASLTGLLRRLQRAFDGAVAIVSGRSVAGLEQLLAPLELPLAGVHGLERRDARGVLHRHPGGDRDLESVRRAVRHFVAERDGLHWEDKGGAIAVHYRDAPAHADALGAFLEEQRAALGDDYHIQPGKAVFELKPAGRNKGRVVADFMAEPPFAGRVPVFVGDDITDEDAFAWVNAHGGVSIRIGGDEPTAARHRLPSVDAALAWLGGLPDAVARGAGPAGRSGAW